MCFCGAHVHAMWRRLGVPASPLQGTGCGDPDVCCLLSVSVRHGRLRPRRRLGAKKRPLKETRYGLLPAFLDGMFDVCLPTIRIVDAYEGAYGYVRREQFLRAYWLVHNAALTQPVAKPLCGSQDAYRRYGRAGFGVWVDHGKVIDNENLANNVRTPRQFWGIVRMALEISDGYVWIYSQKVNWWDPASAPAHQAALRSVRQERMARISREE